MKIVWRHDQIIFMALTSLSLRLGSKLPNFTTYNNTALYTIDL